MPSTRKDQAPVVLDIADIEGRYVDLGGYTVALETYRADADPAELFRGLPDDRCQCPHWGVVVSGSISLGFADMSRPTPSATQVRSIDVARLGRRVGRLPASLMDGVDEALRVHLAL